MSNPHVTHTCFRVVILGVQRHLDVLMDWTNGWTCPLRHLQAGQTDGHIHYVIYKLDILDIFFENSLKIPRIYSNMLEYTRICLNILEYFLVGRT
jgi:hypothetical protein